MKAFWILICFCLTGCLRDYSTDPASVPADLSIFDEAEDYGSLPAYSETGYVHVVVEIPAGTNKKREYDYETNTFPIDQKEGQDRIINYLPYPGNYGFIPSTLMDEARGGDGDALDVLVLGEHLPTSSLLEVIPIAMLELKDGGEIDNKILAVPAVAEAQIIRAQSLLELDTDYPSIRTQIATWFASYKGYGMMEVVGWKDEIAASAEIKKWVIKQ